MKQATRLSEFQVPQDVAEVVLAKFQKRHSFPFSPPVPVEMIAHSVFDLLCITRALGHLGQKTAGVLSVEKKAIFLEKKNDWHTYNFTIAHELGHYILHEEGFLNQLSSFNNSKFLPQHRLGSSRVNTLKEKERLLEVEANRFAAALLVPRSFLLTELKAYHSINAKAIGELSKTFDVSPQTMFYRIMDLYEHLLLPEPPIEGDAFKLQSVLLEIHANTNENTWKQRWLQHARNLETDNPVTISKLDGLNRQPKNLSVKTQNSSFTSNFTKTIDRIATNYKSSKKWQIERNETKTPYIIEFAGTANAGKDTQIAIVKSYLQDVHGFKVRVIDEAIKSCHISKNLEIHRTYKSVALTVGSLYEARFENPGDYDFVIFNRGVFDRMTLIRAAHHSGQIQEEQERIHLDYLSAYAHLEDMVFLLLISPQESMRREEESLRRFVATLALQQDGKQPAPQRYHDTAVLEVLNTAYKDIYRCYESYFKQICLPDAFEIGNDSMDNSDTQSILDKASKLTQTILKVHKKDRKLTCSQPEKPSILIEAAPNSTAKQLPLFEYIDPR